MWECTVLAKGEHKSKLLYVFTWNTPRVIQQKNPLHWIKNILSVMYVNDQWSHSAKQISFVIII